MKRTLLVVAILALVVGCGVPRTSEQSTGMRTKNQHKAVVIVVDSLTDRAIRAACNNEGFTGIHYLMSHGHYLPHVVASFPSMTVSGLSTVLTGAYPDEHNIPGLVWFDTKKKEIVNYGNNLQQTLKLGTRSVSRNALYDLNETHLAKGVHTIFEDLQDAGYSTGAVNMLVYRGRQPHQLKLPVYTRPFTGTSSFTVHGPDALVFGQFSSEGAGTGEDGMFHKFGLNDNFATDSLVHLIKEQKLPDFTMVYMPSNDTVVHKHGVDAMAGVSAVDKNICKILSSYGNWDDTLKRLTLVVMGDGGISPILPTEQHPTIFLSHLFPNHALYHWGSKQDLRDDIALAINSRMAYVYLLSARMRPDQTAEKLKRDQRIDVVAWTDGREIYVAIPQNDGTSFSFHKEGPFIDPYGQTWGFSGNPSTLAISISQHGKIAYSKYPDALHQLWSATHTQKGTYLVVTAKRGYQFGDENAPKHDGGSQQASLLAEDVYAPMIINGTNRVPKEPCRFVDLKNYLISLVKTDSIPLGRRVTQSLTSGVEIRDRQ